MPKPILLLALLLLLSAQAYAECIIPEPGMAISQPAEFCPGSYELQDGISMTAGDTTLDCAGATLLGLDYGTGITIAGISNVSVRNCNIKNFQIGIVLQDASASVVSSNELVNNSIGMILSSSMANDISGNLFDRNRLLAVSIDNASKDNLIYQNTFFQTSFSQDAASTSNAFCRDGIQNTYQDGASEIGCIDNRDIRKIPLQQEQQPIALQEPTQISQPDQEKAIEIIEMILMNDPSLEMTPDEMYANYQSTMENLNIWKSYAQKDDKTLVYLLITPMMPAKNIRIYEYVPKDAAESYSMISFAAHEPDSVILDDPLFVWNFPATNQPVDFSYSVNGHVVGEESSPITIPVTIANKRQMAIEPYYAILAILLIVVGYLVTRHFLRR